LSRYIYKLILFCFLYFLIGAVIYFFESKVLFFIYDFSIPDRNVLNRFNFIGILVMGVISTFILIVLYFRKHVNIKGYFIFVAIKVIFIIVASIYWIIQLQWK